MAASIITLENLLPDDDQDVIIRKTRTTPKTKRQTSELLVLLATQHQYYIKNEQTGEIIPLVAPNIVPDNADNTDATDATDATDNTDTANNTDAPAPIVTNIACVSETHQTRIAKLIKPFIADGIKVGIDHPIQARWLRGVECLLHGTKGVMRDCAKDTLCAISEMIELDYLMANDAAFTSRFITSLKDTVSADLISNAIKTINTYGLITLWALTGGNVVTDDTAMLGHNTSLHLTRCADKPIMKWIMKHQPFIDALVDMKLRFMMGITIATTPGIDMNEINTPQELTDALFKHIDRVRTFASTMPDTDTKSGKNESDAPLTNAYDNYSKTQACINLKNSGPLNRWRHITDPVRMYWMEKLFGDAFLDALAIKNETTGKWYVLNETTDNILGFGAQTIAYLIEQLFDLDPVGRPKTRPDNDPRTVDIDKTIRWIRGYMSANHIQLPKATNVINNVVSMSSYISGFTLKFMLEHMIAEILFNVRSVLNQAIDMRKSCETLIMDAHVDPDTIDMYPKYILDAHDEYTVMARLVENQYLDENIRNVAEQFKWLEETWHDEQPFTWHYQAHVLASNDEFVQEGQRMHNCVATYAKKMSHGDTIIVSIRKKEADDTDWLPYITCELNPVTLAQRQTYKSYNTQLNAHDRNIVDSWIQRVSTKRIAQHNS